MRVDTLWRMMGVLPVHLTAYHVQIIIHVFLVPIRTFLVNQRVQPARKIVLPAYQIHTANHV